MLVRGRTPASRLRRRRPMVRKVRPLGLLDTPGPFPEKEAPSMGTFVIFVSRTESGRSRRTSGCPDDLATAQEKCKVASPNLRNSSIADRRFFFCIQYVPPAVSGGRKYRAEAAGGSQSYPLVTLHGVLVAPGVGTRLPAVQHPARRLGARRNGRPAVRRACRAHRAGTSAA